MNTFINIKNRLFKIINFYALLFLSLPFLTYAYEHKEQLSLNFIFDLSQIIFVCILSLSIIFFLFSKTRLKYYFKFYYLSLFFYLIFNFNNIKVFFYKIFPERFYFLISELSLLSILILFIIIINLTIKHKSAYTFLNRFILIYFLFYFISIFYFIVHKSFISTNQISEEVSKNLNLNNTNELSQNIYYVISDAAINHLLFDEIFDNQLLDLHIKNLKKKNFSNISNSKSNFNNTHLSVTTILNLDYPVTDKSRRYSSLLEFFPYYLSNFKPEIIKILGELKYKFYWQGNIWAECNSHSPRYCLSDRFSINTNLYITFFAKSPFSSIYSNLSKLFKNYTYDPNIIEKFIETHKSLDLNKKSFFLIHQYMPHGPHVYDQDCNRKYSLDEWNNYVKSDYYEKELEGYKNSYLCNLKKLNKLVDHIILYDPNATIVLTADHGHPLKNLNISKFKNSDFKLSSISDEINLYFSMFNFIRTDKNCLNQANKNDIKFDNINTTILALNCSTGSNIKFKPSRSYMGFLPRDQNLFGNVLNLNEISKHHLDLE